MKRLVALDLPGGPGFVEALRRVWDAGDAAFPIDRRLPAAARTRVVDAMGPAAVVDGDGEHARPGGRPVDAETALVVATSGSTGTPKGVVLSHAAVAASAAATSRRLGATAADHWLACLPLAHVGGLSVVTRALHLGQALTVQERFDPAAVAAAAEAGATLVSLVATALRRVDAGLFRTVVLGGARPPDDLPGNVVTTYGMTETGSGIVYDGVPLDGVGVRIDHDGGIHVRGPMLLERYRDGTVPLDSDGWLATGDAGAWVADGPDTGADLAAGVGEWRPGRRLVVHGRQGEMIVTGGENVWPQPVEQLLLGAPGVADAAVAGIDDPEWGQRVVALVVAADRSTPPTLAELRERVKADLPAFCAPREVRLVDAIPRTALGKPRRDRLRDLAVTDG